MDQKQILRGLSAVLLAVVTSATAAPLDRIQGVLYDSTIRSGISLEIDATKMTVRQLRRALGNPNRNQGIGIECHGNAMGRDLGYSAFDIFSGTFSLGEINHDLRKLGVTLDMMLTDVCWRNQRDFERKQGIRR
ncbi:MAG: hypothetical protein QOD26_2642 [Betaproteobacteria bacterium]|nr:hypothetical protein [Betaproteobacteria bacterium]